MYYIRNINNKEVILCLRLPAEVESKLNAVAPMQNKTKSDIIKESLDLYFKTFSKLQSLFKLGKHPFGKHGSSVGNLSIDSEKFLREKFNVKKHS